MPSSVNLPRVLLIDQSEQRAEALNLLLKRAGYAEVLICQPCEDVLERVQQWRPDVVLVEIDNPQRDFIEQLATLRDQCPTPVAVFCQDAEAQNIREAVETGVCAYVVEGVQPSQVRPAITLAMSTFQAVTRYRNEATVAREKLEERKKVDRAKRLLMTSQNLTEQQAYDTVRKLAMDRQRKMSEAADDLIAMMKIVGNTPRA